MASGSLDNTVKLWSVESQKEVATLIGHDNTVTSVAFSPDSKYLASGSEDNTVKLWNVESQKEVTTLEGHTKEVLSVAFSPDGKYLASGSEDEKVMLWSVESQKKVAKLKGHDTTSPLSHSHQTANILLLAAKTKQSSSGA